MIITWFLMFLLSKEIKLVRCLQAREGWQAGVFLNCQLLWLLNENWWGPGNDFWDDGWSLCIWWLCLWLDLWVFNSWLWNLENLPHDSWSRMVVGLFSWCAALYVSSSKPLGNILLWNQHNKTLHKLVIKTTNSLSECYQQLRWQYNSSQLPVRAFRKYFCLS